MPLNEFQKSTIEATVEHLIDLPTEEKALTDAVAILSEVTLESEEKSKCLQEDYLTLAKCLKNPVSYFSNLENSNTTITVGEVQDFLIKFIGAKIECAQVEAKMSKTPLAWDSTAILACYAKKNNFNENFKTLHSPPASLESAYTIAPLDKLFQVCFDPYFDSERVKLTITVDVVPPTTLEYYLNIDSLLDQLPPEARIQENGEAVEFWRIARSENFAELITEQTQDLVGIFILKKVVADLKIEVPSTISMSIYMFLTTRHYYNAVTSEVIRLSDLDMLSSQASLISDSAFYYLIIAKKLSWEKAKKLTYAEILILRDGYYNDLFINDKLILDDLSDCNSEMAYKLLLPQIQNLLKNNKITFQQAKHLTPAVQALVTHEYYFNCLLRGRCRFDEIETLYWHQSDILLKETIMKLISSHTLSVTEAKDLTKEFIALVDSDPLIFYLIENRIIDPDDTEKILLESSSDSRRVTFLPLKENQKKYARLYFRDFIYFAQHGIVFNSDLPYAYTLISTISAELAETKEMPISFPSLIKNKEFIKYCKRNVFLRIQAVFMNVPILLHGKESDTIFRIKLDSQAVGFLSIREEFLDSCIKEYCSEHPSMLLAAAKEAHQLNFSLLFIWGRLIGWKLLDFFLASGSEKELRIIHREITRLSQKYKIGHFDLQSMAIKNFLLILQDKLGNELEGSSALNLDLHRKIHSMINQTRLEEWELSSWRKTFRDILLVVNNFKSHKPFSSRDLDYKPELFPVHLKNEFSSAHELCAHFKSMEFFLEAKKASFRFKRRYCL